MSILGKLERSKQRGFSITELLVTMAIVGGVTSIVVNFLGQYQTANARSSARANANLSANHSLGKIQTLFSNRHYIKTSSDLVTLRGALVGSEGLKLSIKSRRHRGIGFSSVTNRCAKIPGRYSTNQIFKNLSYKPSNSSGPNDQSCLVKINCRAGTYPQIVIFDYRLQSTVKIPDLDSFTGSLQKEVIGQCIFAEIENETLRLSAESVVYEPNSKTRARVVKRQRLLPFENFANLQIIPNNYK